MSPKEETLQLALQKTGIRSLPKALTPNDSRVWITAIVLCRKGGFETYALANNDGKGNPSITHDFGPCIVISEILSVHPIDCLDKRFTPDLRSDKAIITFLSKNGYDEALITAMLDKSAHDTAEEAKADRAKVKGLINQVAIMLAKKMLAEEERCKEIKDYANRIKHGTKESTED